MKWNEKQRAAGLCYNCAKPRKPTSGWFCSDCLHKNNMRAQQWQMDKLKDKPPIKVKL